MNPEYFARALSLYEAKHFIAGLDKRYRAGWEQARFTGYWAAKPHYKDFHPENMPLFFWERDSSAAALIPDERTEEEKMAAFNVLRNYALERDKKLLKIKTDEDGKR